MPSKKSATSAAAPTTTMQGIEVPTSNVNPKQFFQLTRRQTIAQQTFNYAGLGLVDTVQVRQAGIIAGVRVKFAGSLVIALNSGTVATTMNWPYNLLKLGKFSANGQSNLLNASGQSYKVREIMGRGYFSDRGVPRGIGGASPGTVVYQGSMSMNSEQWGVGQNVSAIPAGTYDVEIEWYFPIAFDEVTLTGAIFAQTSATTLDLEFDWAQVTDLFTTTGSPSITLTGTIVPESRLYTIPQVGSGNVVVPDLSTFHSLIESQYTSIGNTLNEVRLAGQGVGKQLLRLYGQLWNGSPSAPLPVNPTNYNGIGWRYGANDTPEFWPDGRGNAMYSEQLFDADIASVQGFWAIDWCKENAFRDSIDEGTATELRAILGIPSGVTLTSPVLHYTQEIMSVGSAA